MRDESTIVVLEGDQTGQELLEEALRVLTPDVIGLELDFIHLDLSLENRRATENQVVCAVRDNGRGIAWLDDSKPLGMGILGMKERAALLGGDVTIRNRPRGGTAVIAAFDKEGLLCRSKRKRSAS